MLEEIRVNGRKIIQIKISPLLSMLIILDIIDTHKSMWNRRNIDDYQHEEPFLYTTVIVSIILMEQKVSDVIQYV